MEWVRASPVGPATAPAGVPQPAGATPAEPIEEWAADEPSPSEWAAIEGEEIAAEGEPSPGPEEPEEELCVIEGEERPGGCA